MREKVEIIEENIEELISLLAGHIHMSIDWDINFMEQLIREINANLRRLRKM